MSLFASQPEITLAITGMHCPKCVARVKEALENVDGVVKAQVSLEENAAVVTGAVDAQVLIAAVEALDFGASLA